MNQDELMHFGVKGMRWGVKKARPSGGTGGKKPAKAKISSAQKKKIRAQAKAEAERIKKTRLADLEKRRDTAAKKAAEKAEKSIFGVGMSKVPGKLEYYHSYRIGTISDGRGKDVKVNHTSHITPKKAMTRLAIGVGIASLMAAYSS